MKDKKVTLSQLAKLIEGKLFLKRGKANDIILRVDTLNNDNYGSVCFIWSTKEKEKLKKITKSTVILKEDLVKYCKTNYIVCKNPEYAYITIANTFFGNDDSENAIHKTAIISSNASIGKNVKIGAYSVIKEAIIGDNCQIESHCIIDDNCSLGNDVHLHNYVYLISNTTLKNNIVIHSGTIIGSDGFGYTKKYNKWLKLPHIGGVFIDKNTEIGCNSTIDKGKIEDTIIGKNVIIDNLVHIAHNVKIGDDCAIAACVGIAGSTTVGKNVLIGGMSGIFGHLTICDDVTITAKSQIYKSINKSGRYTNLNLMTNHKNWLKNYKIMNKNKCNT